MMVSAPFFAKEYPRHHVLNCVGLAVLHLWIAVADSQASSDVTAMDVLAAYEASCDAVPAYDLYLVVRFKVLLERVHDRKDSEANKNKPLWVKADSSRRKLVPRSVTRQFYSLGRFRFDATEWRGQRLPKGALSTVWNGEAELSYNATLKRGSIRPYTRPLSDVGGFCYTNTWKTISGHQSYAECIRLRGPDLTSLEVRNGTAVLTALPKPSELIDFGTFGLRMHLDATKNFMPTQIDVLLYVGEEKPPVLLRRYESRLEEVCPSVWLPVASRVADYQWIAESPLYGEEICYQNLEVDQSRSRFDVTLQDAVFEMEFPRGTVVTDAVRQLEYVVGSEAAAEHLNWLAQRGRLEAERLAATRDRSRKSTIFSSRRSRLVFFVANVVVVALILTFILWSRSVRRQNA